MFIKPCWVVPFSLITVGDFWVMIYTLSPGRCRRRRKVSYPIVRNRSAHLSTASLARPRNAKRTGPSARLTDSTAGNPPRRQGRWLRPRLVGARPTGSPVGLALTARHPAASTARRAGREKADLLTSIPMPRSLRRWRSRSFGVVLQRLVHCEGLRHCLGRVDDQDGHPGVAREHLAEAPLPAGAREIPATRMVAERERLRRLRVTSDTLALRYSGHVGPTGRRRRGGRPPGSGPCRIISALRHVRFQSDEQSH